MFFNILNIKNLFKFFLTIVLLFSVKTIFAEVEIVRINSAAFPISSPIHVAHLLNLFEKEGVNVKMRDFPSGAQAMEGFRAGRADFVVTGFLPTSILTSKADVKIVSTIHGAYNCQNIFKKIYNSVMLNSVKIIAISKYIKNYLLQNYNLTKKKRDKIVVIPRGVDPTKFSPQNIDSKRLFFLTNHWELPDGIPIILFPSRIAPFKGHKTLLKALAILKKDPKIKFICLMVGLSKKNSNYDAEIKSFIEENDLYEYIKFTGSCSYMPAAYKISDIVVSPADKPEGFGRIIIESQSMERPVIASAHGGSLELIKNNFNGILFKPKNEHDLADKLKYLLCLTREKKEEIIKNASASVIEKYNIEKMYDSNFKLYSSLIK